MIISKLTKIKQEKEDIKQKMVARTFYTVYIRKYEYCTITFYLPTLVHWKLFG